MVHTPEQWYCKGTMNRIIVWNMNNDEKGACDTNKKQAESR